MTEQQCKILRELRNEGYAVCVFTPEEMPDSRPRDVEDAMCEGGWRQIKASTHLVARRSVRNQGDHP